MCVKMIKDEDNQAETEMMYNDNINMWEQEMDEEDPHGSQHWIHRWSN